MKKLILILCLGSLPFVISCTHTVRQPQGNEVGNRGLTPQDLQSMKPLQIISAYEDDLKKLNTFQDGSDESVIAAKDILKKYAGFDDVVVKNQFAKENSDRQKSILVFMAKQLKAILPKADSSEFIMVNCKRLYNQTPPAQKIVLNPLGYRTKFVLAVDISEFSGISYGDKKLATIDNPLKNLSGQEQLDFRERTLRLSIGAMPSFVTTENVKAWYAMLANYDDLCFKQNYNAINE